MYFHYTGYGANDTGGHCVIGAAPRPPRWLFAEGYTGPGFDEWLCLQNPGTEEATVEITYLTQELGPLAPKTVKIPAGSRYTLRVNDHAGADLQLSTRRQVRSRATPVSWPSGPCTSSTAGSGTAGTTPSGSSRRAPPLPEQRRARKRGGPAAPFLRRSKAFRAPARCPRSWSSGRRRPRRNWCRVPAVPRCPRSPSTLPAWDRRGWAAPTRCRRNGGSRRA